MTGSNYIFKISSNLNERKICYEFGDMKKFKTQILSEWFSCTVYPSVYFSVNACKNLGFEGNKKAHSSYGR